MSLEIYLYNLLMADPTVVAITLGQIYPLVEDVDTQPAWIQFRPIAIDPMQDLKNTFSFNAVHMRFEYTANNYQQLLDLGAAMRNVLAFKDSTLLAAGQGGTIQMIDRNEVKPFWTFEYQAWQVWKIFWEESLPGS